MIIHETGYIWCVYKIQLSHNIFGGKLYQLFCQLLGGYYHRSEVSDISTTESIMDDIPAWT